MRASILKEALMNLFRRPATLKYPLSREGVRVPESHRGAHYVDFKKCTGCTLCALDCPSGAIEMSRIELNLRTNPRSLFPVIYYDRCVFCYHCVYVCPVKAYITTNDFELIKYQGQSSLNYSLKAIERAGER